MKQFLIRLFKLLGLYKTYKCPKYISSNFISLSSEKTEILKTSLYERLGFNFNDTKFNLKISIDVEEHLFGRINSFRNKYIPFLIETIGIKDKSILEIGCGTGALSVALLEQGGKLTGIDIEENALIVAKKRLDLYNLKADLFLVNSKELDSKFQHVSFDIVVFTASLEHMTPDERIQSIRSAFNIIKNGGHLCLFGSPNRLWHFDRHTSLLPFYFWLQDDIAISYSKFSDRDEFNKIYNKQNAKTELYRWGMGLSFHEVEIALNKRTNDLVIIQSLPIFLRRQSFIQKLNYKMSDEYKYKKILQKNLNYRIHPGFFESYIDIIIQK